MKFMKFNLFFLFYIISINFGMGQPNQRVIPPSPKTAEFTKYINHNVSKYNGIPEISIPLYNIEIDNLIIPIQLNYHASGIKFNQENGEIGVGWTLSTGYRVSRTINAYPDEKEEMPSYILDSLNYYEFDKTRRDNYLSRFMEYGVADRPFSISGEQLDGEFDFFNFSLPTNSGRFIISNRINKEVKTIEESNLKINYKTGQSSNGINNGIIGLNIVDEEGIKYFFGESLPLNNNIVFEATTSQYGGFVNTAWAMTDLITPMGEKVHFNYDQGSGGRWNGNVRNFTFIESTRDYGDPFPFGYSYSDEGQSGYYDSFFLKEILTPSETIVFSRNSNANGTWVSCIYIYSRINNALLKRIEFIQGSNNYHTFLEKVKIFDSNNNLIEVYQLEYNGRDSSNLGPFIADQWGYYKGSISSTLVFHDKFGDDLVSTRDAVGQTTPLNTYLADISAKDFVDVTPDLFALKKITYPTGGSSSFLFESNKFRGLDNSIKDGGGIRIKTIESNDGFQGHTLVKEFIYGIDECGFGVSPLYINHNMFVNETVRFREHPTMPEWDLFPQRKLMYSSNIQGDISGVLSSFVSYPVVTEYFKSPQGNENIGKIRYEFNLGEHFNTDSYSAEFNPNASGIGAFPLQYQPGYPLNVSRYRLWDNPRLIKQETYAKINNQYEEIKEEVYNYQSKVSQFHGLKVREFATSDNYRPFKGNYYEYLSSFFNFGEYIVELGKNILIEKIETTKTSNGDLSTKTNFHVNSLNQVIRESKINSKGEELNSYFRYPADIIQAFVPSNDPINKPISFLIESNIIGNPIEIFHTIKKNGEELMLSSHITTYKGNLINKEGISFYASLPFKTYKLIRGNNLKKIDYLGFNIENEIIGEVEILDANFECDFSYDYDLFGNIKQITPYKNLPLSYIWGYDNTYPIAECKNASGTEIFYDGFEQSGNLGTAHTGTRFHLGDYVLSFTKPNAKAYEVSYWYRDNGEWKFSGILSYTGPVTLTLGDAIDDVRIHPVGALMTTYTYEPLVGMTSSSDPNGLTTFYDYDGYGRLKLVRDQDRNILSSYCYNYAGQLTDCDAIFSSTARSQTFNKSDCPSGQTGSQEIYTVAAGAYNSTLSQPDADAKAQADIDANGQTYANQYGYCIQSSTYVNWSNSISTGLTVTFSPLAGGQDISFPLDPNSSGSWEILSGTYHVTITPQPYSYGTFYYYFNGYYQTGYDSSSVTFSNITMSSGSSNSLQVN